MTLDLKGLKSYFEVNASILDGSSGVSKVMWGSKLVNTFGEPYKLNDLCLICNFIDSILYCF